MIAGLAAFVVLWRHESLPSSPSTSSGGMPPSAASTLSQSLLPGIAPPASQTLPVGLRTPDAAVAAMTDQEISSRLLGAWTTQFHGVQQVQKHDNWTADLRIDFDWLASLLYGSQMHLHLRWSVKDGVLTHVIERGSPQSSVKRLIHDFGDTCAYRVLKLGENELLLQEIADPDSFHRWLRLPSESAKP